jgi:hydrogenase maturation protease
MSRVLIIGYGNTLRGDDGIGWYAARDLSVTEGTEDFKSIACHQLTPELAKDISESDCTIFIDASVGGCPGAVTIRKLAMNSFAVNSITHHMNPETLLLLASELYYVHPTAYLITVDGESFDHEEELSPVVRETLPRLLEYIRFLAAPFPVCSGAEVT